MSNYTWASAFKNVQAAENDTTFDVTEHDTKPTLFYSVKTGSFNLFNYELEDGSKVTLTFSYCRAAILHASPIMKLFTFVEGENEKNIFMTLDDFFAVTPSGRKLYEEVAILKQNLPDGMHLQRYDVVKYLLGLDIPTADYEVENVNGRGTTKKTLSNVVVDNIVFTYKGKTALQQHKKERDEAFKKAKELKEHVLRDAGINLPHYAVMFDLFTGSEYKASYKDASNKVIENAYKSLGFDLSENPQPSKELTEAFLEEVEHEGEKVPFAVAQNRTQSKFISELTGIGHWNTQVKALLAKPKATPSEPKVIDHNTF